MTLKPSAALTTLAEYLTHPALVTRHSVGLELGGAAKQAAEAFFALRRAFNVDGYVDKQQALAAIEKTIGG